MQPLLFFLLTVGTITQKTPAPTETISGFNAQINFVFAHLDKSKISTGILRDYAVEFVNLEYFNGKAPLTDSNYAHAISFWQVFNTLLAGRINSNAKALIHGDTLDNRWYNQRKQDVVTLCGLHFDYTRFKDEASPNSITIRNGQLFDKYVGHVWQNPYQAEKVFLVSPSVNVYSELSFQVVLPENLWLTNSNGDLSVDLGDGNGFRTLTPGANLSVSYSSAGLKEWTYRLQTATGDLLFSHSMVSIGS